MGHESVFTGFAGTSGRCRYGRTPAGRHLDQAVPLPGGPNGVLVVAPTSAGRGALLGGDGAVNGAVFAAYLDQGPGSSLRPGNAVVLANLSGHKVDGLAEIAKKYGARLRYLPPCSPVFNPVALVFSKLKTWLRTAKARTRDVPAEALLAAGAWITEQVPESGLTIAVILYSNVETALKRRTALTS